MIPLPDSCPTSELKSNQKNVIFKVDGRRGKQETGILGIKRKELFLCNAFNCNGGCNQN